VLSECFLLGMMLWLLLCLRGCLYVAHAAEDVCECKFLNAKNGSMDECCGLDLSTYGDENFCYGMMLSLRTDGCCADFSECGRTGAFGDVLQELRKLAIADFATSLSVVVAQLGMLCAYASFNHSNQIMLRAALILLACVNFADMVLEVIMMILVYGPGTQFINAINALLDARCFVDDSSGADHILYAMKSEFDTFGVIESVQFGVELMAGCFKLPFIFLGADDVDDSVGAYAAIIAQLCGCFFDILEAIGAGVSVFRYLDPLIENFETVLGRMNELYARSTSAADRTRMVPCVYTCCDPTIGNFRSLSPLPTTMPGIANNATVDASGSVSDDDGMALVWWTSFGLFIFGACGCVTMRMVFFKKRRHMPDEDFRGI